MRFVLENGANAERETLAAFGTLESPLILKAVDLAMTAVGAMLAIFPYNSPEIINRRLLIRDSGEKIVKAFELDCHDHLSNGQNLPQIAGSVKYIIPLKG
jgi:hypothetical protein